jgi:hypothetical protein
VRQKYVVFDDVVVLCFGDVCQHSHTSVKNMKPTSAGFFGFSSEISYLTEEGEHWPEGRAVTSIYTYGRSESLNLDSKVSDARLIELSLGIR